MRLIITLALILFSTLSANAAWYNGDWLYRHQITVKASEINGDLNGFPVLIELEDMPNRFYSKVKASGADIRMTSNDEVTELPIELVNFNKSKKRGELYFKAPFIDNGSDTDFYLYYGNSSATAYSDTDEFGAENVWANGTFSIYQMNTNPANGILDSAGFQDLSENGGMSNSDSIKNKLGTSLDFDGTNDEAFQKPGARRKVHIPRIYNFNSGSQDVIDFGDHDDFSFTDGVGNDMPFSVSGWFYSTNSIGTLIAKHIDGDATDGEFHFISVAGEVAYFRVVQDSANAYLGRRTNASVVTPNTWHHFVGTYDGSKTEAGLKIYLDGKRVDTLDSSTGTYTGMENTTGELTVGTRGVTSSQHRLNGTARDVRLYSRELTAADAYKIYSSGRIIYPNDLVVHMKGEDTKPEISYDSSGNGHHGIKTNINLSTFHTTDPTAPISFSNEVGYTPGRNMLVYSEEIDRSPSWWKTTSGGSAPTVDPNVAAAPDGTMTADRVNFTTNANTNGDRVVQQTGDHVSTGTYTFSIYARTDSGAGTLRLNSWESNGGNLSDTYTLTNSWQRYTHTRTFSDFDATFQNFQLRSGSDAANSILLWGAQVEPGDTATDYQKTVVYETNGDIIPRNEANITQDIFGNSLEYSGQVPHYAYPTRSNTAYFNGGVMFEVTGTASDPDWDFTNNGFSFITNFTRTTAGTRTFFSKGTNGTGRGILVRSTAGSNIEITIGNGTATLVTTTGTYTPNVDDKLGITWDHNTGNLTVLTAGGIQEEFDTNTTSANYQDDPRDMQIGAHYSAGYFLGHMDGMAFYNRPLGQQEVYDAFENNNYAGSNGLLAYYPMAEGNGTVLYDASGNENHATQGNGDDLETWTQTQNGYHYNFDFGYNLLENYTVDSEDLSTANWNKVTAPAQTTTTITGNGTINFGLANSTTWNDYPTVYQGKGINQGLALSAGEELYTTFTLSGVPGTTIGYRCTSEFDTLISPLRTATLTATPTDYECRRQISTDPEAWFNYGIYRHPTHTASTVTVHRIHTYKSARADYVKTEGNAVTVSAHVPALITNPSIDALGNSINGTHFITNLDSDLTAPYKAVSLNTREQDLTAFVRFSTSAIQEQIIFEKGEEDDGYKLFLDSSGRLNFSQNGDIGFNAINSAASFNDGEIHNAFVTIDHTANGISLYVDNNLAANNTFSEVDFAPVGNITIAGKDQNNDDNFDGRIYQVRFFNSLMDSNGISAIENNYDFDDFFYDVDGAPPKPADDGNSFMWGGQ